MKFNPLRRIHHLSKFSFAALLFLSFAGTLNLIRAQALPDSARNLTQSLNGDWHFKYIPSLDAGKDADFFQITFDASGWSKIAVPGNWEILGIIEPAYSEPEPGLGLYRRTFDVSEEWRGGRRVFLRLDGVGFGFRAWVNGKEVGVSQAGAFLPHTFDVTDSLKDGQGSENLLAVEVTTRPFGWEFDVNDDWALSGIFRDVKLFSVPAVYMRDLTVRTKLSDTVFDAKVGFGWKGEPKLAVFQGKDLEGRPRSGVTSPRPVRNSCCEESRL